MNRPAEAALGALERRWDRHGYRPKTRTDCALEAAAWLLSGDLRLAWLLVRRGVLR